MDLRVEEFADLVARRAGATETLARTDSRARLSSDVENWIASGNAITVVPLGTLAQRETGYGWTPSRLSSWPLPAIDMPE